MTIASAQELLAHELQDIRDAEIQAGKALQQMSREAQDDEIKDLLERRMEEGERVLDAVEQGLEAVNGGSKGRSNAAARALIEETQRLLQEVQTPEMKQAAMIAGAQKLEHYCIAAWGTVKALASECGQNELAREMERAVEEGYQWDEEMSDLAESRINPEAIESAMEGEVEEESEEDSRDGSERSSSSKAARGRPSNDEKGSGGEKGSGRSDAKSREQRGGEKRSNTRKKS
jgi:ferritin-like metal-binding protein YciE